MRNGLCWKNGGWLRDRESRNVLSYSNVSVPPPQPVFGERGFGFLREIREWERSYKTPLLDTLHSYSYITFIRD